MTEAHAQIKTASKGEGVRDEYTIIDFDVAVVTEDNEQKNVGAKISVVSLSRAAAVIEEKEFLVALSV